MEKEIPAVVPDFKLGQLQLKQQKDKLILKEWRDLYLTYLV